MLFRFDTNNDGIILLKEMKKFVRDIHFLFSPTELESISEKDIVGQAFNEMDKDHDGKVTEDEFVAATLAHEKMASMLTLKIVQVFDP
jgi:Ca2+-binding EF-hand superfamily protein